MRNEYNGFTTKNLWDGDYDSNTRCEARFKSMIRIVHSVSLGTQRMQNYGCTGPRPTAAA